MDVLTTKLAGANAYNAMLQKELAESKQKCEELEAELAAKGSDEDVQNLKSINSSLHRQMDDATTLMSSLRQSAQTANTHTRNMAKLFEEKLSNAMAANKQAASRHMQEKEKLQAEINKLEKTVKLLEIQTSND